MRRWPLVWLVVVAAAAAVATEWMRAPGWVLALGLVLLAPAALLAAWRLGGSAEGGAAAALGSALVAATAVLVLVFTRRVVRIERHWPAVREAEITAASRRLGGELDAAVGLVRALADAAAPSLLREPPQAFAALQPLIGRDGDDPVHGVALFDTRGRPYAWAGPQRIAVLPEGPELDAVTTPFYLWLVARRQTNAGAAVAAVMLARDSALPRAGDALADRFAAGTGVGVRFFSPLLAPADTDVFDYVQPARSGARDTLFAVQPRPPEQGAALSRVLVSARRLVAWALLLLLAVAACVAVRSRALMPASLLPAGAAALALARAPLKDAFGAGSLFWPDTYFRPLLGPYSASAGQLLLVGAVLALLGSALWRRGLRPSFWSRVVAVIITILAPYLLQDLARGITPPASGVTTGLWLLWQATLMLAASAVVLIAAALVRGTAPAPRAGPWPLVAGFIAVGAAVAGLWLWEPLGAWPEWYPYLWVPALIVSLKPMPLRGTLASVAIVAGSAAALLTWGATTEGRIALATRDVEGLGDRTDPLAVALLDRLIHETPIDSAPRSAGDLYVLWRRSALGSVGYPASLALWTPAGEQLISLDLAELELPVAAVRQAVREVTEEALPVARPIQGVPGLHGLAAIPLLDRRVLTVVVGPRSRLLLPTRVARLLSGGPQDPEPPYDLLLSPPGPPSPPATRGVEWARRGWQVRGERVLDLVDGPRHVHAQVDLRGPSALLQRGALVLVLDFVILAALWLLVEVADGRAIPALWSLWPRAYRSLRVRLTVSLALFFVLPTLAFAVWSYGRLGEEFRGARDLLLQRTLRDAGAALEAGRSDPGVAVLDASRRVDAELFLSRGGELVATSAPVLADLGLVDWLVPAPAFARLAYGDELELSMAQRAAAAPTLVGFRLLARAEPRATGILASPEFLGDATLRRREGDLGIAVLVATAVGLLAALVLSAFGARALARPLQRLKSEALAVGSGALPAGEPETMPVELEPVHAAIVQAAADVEAGQRAQRVLAWGEMARQIAHEIKNPLTPIRLGIQHLLRLHRDRPAEFGPVLSSTGERILNEIDRLDAIARSFSRFALPTAEGRPLEPLDLPAVVREVLNLYRLGEGGPAWEERVEDGATALARRDELVEVLVNLCENARDAGARRVVVLVRADEIQVKDDGRGIPAEALPHVFEPRFSTTTSGSGLGLAIVKRLVEGWGGSIAIEAGEGAGTTVTIRLAAARQV